MCCIAHQLQGHKLILYACLASASSSFEKQNAVRVSLEEGGGIRCRLDPQSEIGKIRMAEKNSADIRISRIHIN